MNYAAINYVELEDRLKYLNGNTQLSTEDAEELVGSLLELYPELFPSTVQKLWEHPKNNSLYPKTLFNSTYLTDKDNRNDIDINEIIPHITQDIYKKAKDLIDSTLDSFKHFAIFDTNDPAVMYVPLSTQNKNQWKKAKHAYLNGIY